MHSGKILAFDDKNMHLGKIQMHPLPEANIFRQNANKSTAGGENHAFGHNTNNPLPEAHNII